MPAVDAADQLYRVIVDFGKGGFVLRGRRYATLASAHAGLIAALRGDTDRRISSIEVQRGVRVEFACADAYTVEPGVRGGWSYISWETIERLTPWTLDALRRAPLAHAAADAASSGRRTALAGITAVGLVVAAVLGLQTLGAMGGGSAVAGVRPMTALPISREAVEQAAKPADGVGHSLEQTLTSALYQPKGPYTPEVHRPLRQASQ